jgi:hypothetical protein
VASLLNNTHWQAFEFHNIQMLDGDNFLKLGRHSFRFSNWMTLATKIMILLFKNFAFIS